MTSAPQDIREEDLVAYVDDACRLIGENKSKPI